MLGNIGPGMIILIVIVALLLFGPSKLPELGRAFGRTLNEFKKGAKDMMSDDDKNEKNEIQSSDSGKSVENKAEEKNNDNRRLPE